MMACVLIGRDCRAELGCVGHAQFLSELGHGFSHCDPAAVDLDLIVGAPFVSTVGTMSDAGDGTALSRALVKYDIRRYARVSERGHVECRGRHPHAVVLKTG